VALLVLLVALLVALLAQLVRPEQIPPLIAYAKD
jgi:hypothetical protein